MPKYRFTEIAFNSTAKKKPTEADKDAYIGLEHLDSGTLTVSRWGSDVAPIGEKLIMKKGDILFGKRRAYQKKVGIAPFDGIFSAHGMVLRPREEVITKEYFPLFISSDYFLDEAIRISVGSLSPTVNWKDLKDLEFNIPTIEEQRRITPLVWAAIETKNAYKSLISGIDDLVKSQFIEMFGDPIENEKGWKHALFPEVTTIVLGSTPRTNKAEYWDGNIKWISPAELTDETFYVYDTVKHITEAGVAAAGLKPFPAGTVIFSTRAPIGKTAIAGCEMYCNQGFKNFICGPELRPVYLYYLLKVKKEYFERLGTGTTFKELSRGAIEKISISVPPLQMQDEFEHLYLQSDKSKFELEQAIQKVDNLIKSLISQE